MQDVKKETTAREYTELDRLYRKIGISALAAALPYQTVSKNPAYAPTASRYVKEDEDVAA